MEETSKKPMDRKKRLEDCRNVLSKIPVPVELFNSVTIPILATISTLSEVITDMEAEEANKGKEYKANADGSIQRPDADSAKPDAGR